MFNFAMGAVSSESQIISQKVNIHSFIVRFIPQAFWIIFPTKATIASRGIKNKINIPAYH